MMVSYFDTQTYIGIENIFETPSLLTSIVQPGLEVTRVGQFPLSLGMGAHA